MKFCYTTVTVTLLTFVIHICRLLLVSRLNDIWLYRSPVVNSKLFQPNGQFHNCHDHL